MRGEIREKVLKALSTIIVLNMAFGGFLGLMMIDEGPAQVASGYPTTTNVGDIIVDGLVPGSEELRITNVHFKQDGDIIIQNGGKCYIDNAILEFLVDLNQSNRHTLTIDGVGSELILQDAKITISTRDLENYENVYWFGSTATGAKFTRPIMFNITATGGSSIWLEDSELAYHGYLDIDGAGTQLTMRNSKTTHPYAPRTSYNWGVILRVTNSGEAILEDSRIESSPFLQGVSYNGGIVSNSNVTMYDYHKIVDNSRLILINSYLDINFENRYNPSPPAEYNPSAWWPDDISPFVPNYNTNYEKRMLWIENSDARFYGLTVNMAQTGNAIDPVYGHTALYVADTLSEVALYRWLVVRPLDNASVPVEGSIIQVDPISGPPLSSDIILLNDPTDVNNLEVADYLTRTTDATITQNGLLLEGTTGSSGRVIFGVVSDIIEPEDMPNSLYVGRYNVTATYENLAAVPPISLNVTYGNAGLSEYPFVTEDDNYFDLDDMPPFNCRIPHPDLYAQFTTDPPSTLINGSTLTISITVFNWQDPVFGGLDVSNVRVEIWDGDPELNSSNRIGFQYITSILSGTNETVAFNWTPSDPGVYTLYVAVDTDYTNPFNDNVIPELDETNNLIIPTPSVEVLERPDLSIVEITFIAEPSKIQENYVVDGTTVTISAKVLNSGGSEVTNVNVSFYDGTVTPANLIGWNILAKVTGNGGQKLASVNWVATEGIHDISVKVDPNDDILELDEMNNTLMQQIVVKSKPDLVPGVTIAPDPSFQGETLSVTIIVSNIGGWNITSPFNLKVYDGDASGPITLIDTYTISQIDSGDWGGVNTVYVNFTRTAAYPPSTHYIWASVDTDFAIDESDETNNQQFNSYTVNPKPNLVVETDDIVFTPDGYPMNGSTVTIDVTIHNNGLFDVDITQIPFYVELRLDDPETGTILATLTVNSVIASGGSTVVQYVWPVATPPGEHYIYTIVDTQDNVSETTNDDNMASARIIMYQVPTDLIVNNTFYGTYTFENAKPSPYARDGFTLVEESGKLTVKNSIFRVEGQLFDDEWNIVVREGGILEIEEDSLITSDGKHVNIYLYDNAALYINDSTIDDMVDIIATDSSEIFISDGSIIEGDIYANDQNSLTNILIINSTLSKDLQYIGGNTVVELWGVIIGGSPADETVVSVADDAIVYVDWFLTVYIVDANNVPIENANVNWSRSPPWSDTGSGVSDSDGITLYRLRGRNITADNVVIGIGNYQIKSDFFSPITTTKYYPDSNVSVWMTSNVDTTIYFSSVKPDLDPPLYIEYPGSFPAVGDTLTITSWVNNTGANGAEIVYVTFFDNRTTTGLPKTLYNASIPAGESWPIQFTVVPTQPGLHNISIHIDPDNITWEYEEGDNVAWRLLDVAAQKADLEITTSDIWFTSNNPLGPNEYTEDDQITIHVQIRNIGATDAYPGGGLDVAYSVIGIGQIGIDNIPGVPAGESRESTFVWTGTSPPGMYTIEIVVDPPPPAEGAVQETDENNNQASKPINIREKADLIPIDIEFFVAGSPVTSVPDTTLVTITVTVKNNGSTNATGVKVSFSDGDGGPAIGSEQTIFFLPILKTEEASVTWTATVAGLSQVHSIYAIVSGVEESDYTNNEYFEDITVTLRPDLTVDSIVFDDNSPFAGQDLTITATIENSGGTSADNFYVSFWDGDPASGGTQIQGDQGPITVGIGLTENIQVTWTNPSNGSHTIFVKADDEQDINEFNELNNIESSVIVVYSGNDLIVNDANMPYPPITPGENALEPLPYQHRGFTLVEENGVLTMDYTTFTVVQTEDYQYNIIVRNNGTFIIQDNSLITTDGFFLRIYLYDDAKLKIYDSIISSNVVEILAFDNAEIIIEESEINSFIMVTSTTAAVTLAATNSSISQAFINFGGNSYATFTNVFTPKVTISGNAQLDVYRWLEAYVKDGAGGAIPQADVTVRDFADNPIGPTKKTDDAQGMALFSILTDEITADSVVTYFNFKVNATYNYQLQDYYGDTLVSFPSYLVDPQDNVEEAVIYLWDLRPDLTVDGADISFYEAGEDRGNSPPVGVGELITVEVVVTNIGTTAVNHSVVRFYHKIHGFEFEIGRDTIDLAIAPDGGTGTASITWVPKDNEVGNGRFFYVEVDPADLPQYPNGSIAELNEFNNDDFTDVNIVLPADLEVYNVRFEVGTNQDADNTTEGQEVTIAVRIKNVGAAGANTASSMTVAAYIGFPDHDGDGKPDSPLPTDVDLIKSSTLDPGVVLGLGESLIVYLTWDTTDLIAGHFIYCYVLDATEINGFVIPDTILANNNMSKEFLVHPKPDLRPRVIPPATSYILIFNEDGITPYTGDVLQIGQRIRLQATIFNDGDVYLPEVNVTFYDGVPGGPDTDQIGQNQTLSLGPNEYGNVTVIWEVDAAVGTVDLTVVVNEFEEVPESDYANNDESETFDVALAEITLGWMTILDTKYTVGDTINIEVSTIFTDTGAGVPNVPYTIRIRNAITDEAVGAAVTGTSNPVGSIVNEITAPSTEGEYYVQVTVTYGGVPHELNSATFEVEPEPGELPWLLILILIGIAIGAVLIVGAALAKFGLGKLVECGECGAFIPEGEKKCPKCGAVFEADTAKCSECGGWIPVKSKSCPECGAIFAGIEKDKKDYIERMKTQYMEYVDQYRDEAKGDLGANMTDEQFMDWWKANPKYVGFEEWLTREEELRKGKTRNCPSCNTINPESAAICFKCGTIFKEEEEEEDFIEEEAGPPPEVQAKAVPATVAPKAAPPTVVPKKVVQPPAGGGAPPTVVPKKVVQAPPTVVPKKVIKKPPEEK